MTNTAKQPSGSTENWSGSDPTYKPPSMAEYQQRCLETTLASSAPLMELLLRAALLCASIAVATTSYLTKTFRD